MGYGEMVTITQSLSDEAVTILADDFKRQVEIVHAQDEVEEAEEAFTDKPEDLKPRSPVITVMGHVDHGKTSLLDAIRETEVAAGEAGGITQHIGAYQVKHDGRLITFLDTPGHEAFTAMRARGAKVTDIAAIVVAADDGVMPQTVEAIDHAKAAAVPILIVVNKIDKPEANPEKIKQQLTEYGIVPEEWGGETIFVETSAKQRLGLDNFLDMLLLVAEVTDLKANPDAPASGYVIESKVDPGRGVVATMLVLRGSIRVGDAVRRRRSQRPRARHARLQGRAARGGHAGDAGRDRRLRLAAAGRRVLPRREGRAAGALVGAEARQPAACGGARQAALADPRRSVRAHRAGRGPGPQPHRQGRRGRQPRGGRGRPEADRAPRGAHRHHPLRRRRHHRVRRHAGQRLERDHHRLQRAPQPARAGARRAGRRRHPHLQGDLQGHRGRARRTHGHAQAGVRRAGHRLRGGAPDVQGRRAWAPSPAAT